MVPVTTKQLLVGRENSPGTHPSASNIEPSQRRRGPHFASGRKASEPGFEINHWNPKVTKVLISIESPCQCSLVTYSQWEP